MSERTSDAWEALDGDWHYLGRPVEDGFDVATLILQPPAAGPAGEEGSAEVAPPRRPSGGRVAAAFASRNAAREFVAAAPPGVELLKVSGEDLRAKEEWLRALVAQGIPTLVFDPRPASIGTDAASRRAIAVHTALGFILSQRNATACL